MAQFFPVPGDRQQRRIGLLGGSFNPAHAGHLHISREAMKRLGLHQVWWLVSPQNPLKPLKGMAPLKDRLAGARAIATDTNIIVGDLETGIHSTRTANVVAALSKRFPRISFVWLMGADNLEQIPRWWHWTRIFHSVCVAVLDRSPYAYQALSGMAAQRFRRARTKPSRALLTRTAPAWSYLAIRRHAASGTAIRQLQKLND
jgi:nicotinate-nucleotide adenylyltransferase